MKFIQDMIQDKMSDAIVGQIGKKFGVDASKANGLVKLGLPLILGGLAKNAMDKKGAESLDKALAKDHDGSMLDNLTSMLGTKETEDDGNKILGHVFGDKLGDITSMLGKSADTDPKVAGGVLGSLAPIVLGQLGKTKREQGLDASSLASMLSDEKKESDNKLGGFMKLLDRDGDGQVVDDIMDLAKKFIK